MRDSLIEAGKEKVQMNLSPPAVESQESPFPRDIDREALAKFSEFTREAKAYFVDRIRAFAEQLILNSAANADESRLDNVSAKNVEMALDQYRPAPPSRLRRFAGIFGGIFLGAGISALVSMLMAGQVTEIGSILAFSLSVAGAFLIAFDK